MRQTDADFLMLFASLAGLLLAIYAIVSVIFFISTHGDDIAKAIIERIRGRNPDNRKPF